MKDGFYLGIDVGGTFVKAGVFDNKGKLVEKFEIPVREGVLPLFEDVFEKLFSYVDADKIIAAGIGIPGPVEFDTVVKGCVNLGWGDVNLYEVTRRWLSCPVYALNDANAAALGEVYAGNAKGYKSAVFITIGTGVGGGVVVGDRLIPGFNGGAGEIGHMPVVNDETSSCTCGKCGCLEQRASATGIVKRVKYYKDSSYKGKLQEEFSARDVFDLAKEGDELCLRVVDEACYYLGVALANVACVVDPDVFIVGGGVSRAGEFLTEKIRKVYEEKAFIPSKKTKVLLASLGNDAGMYGACKFAMDKEYDK